METSSGDMLVTAKLNGMVVSPGFTKRSLDSPSNTRASAFVGVAG
jgi:hypothetical protein